MFSTVYDAPSNPSSFSRPTVVTTCKNELDRPGFEEIGLIRSTPMYAVVTPWTILSSPVKKQSDISIPLTKDEILYLLDSIKDFEEGRFTLVPIEESDSEFLKKLKAP